MARIWLFGEDVDTDQILPGRYAPFMTSEAELPQTPVRSRLVPLLMATQPLPS